MTQIFSPPFPISFANSDGNAKIRLCANLACFSLLGIAFWLQSAANCTVRCLVSGADCIQSAKPPSEERASKRVAIIQDDKTHMNEKKGKSVLFRGYQNRTTCQSHHVTTPSLSYKEAWHCMGSLQRLHIEHAIPVF